MPSRSSRRAQQGSARSRRTPVKPVGSRGASIPWIPIVVVLGVIAVVAGIGYLIIESGKDSAGPDKAQAIENNEPPYDGPGEWVDLPTAWAVGDVKAHYGASGGEPNTNAHVSGSVDYSKEVSANSATGLPPVGGAHWGSGSCGKDPKAAPANCGPVDWGAYRDPFEAESVVHNMEHGGVVVWYNSSDISVRDRLEEWVVDEGERGAFVVLMPYPDIPDDTVAITSWGRRDVFPVSDLTEDRVKDFIETFNCRFNPESFNCGDMG